MLSMTRIEHPSDQFEFYCENIISAFETIKRKNPEYSDDQIISMMHIAAMEHMVDGSWEFTKLYNDFVGSSTYYFDRKAEEN